MVRKRCWWVLHQLLVAAIVDRASTTAGSSGVHVASVRWAIVLVVLTVPELGHGSGDKVITHHHAVVC